MKKMKNQLFGKSMLFAFAISALFLFQNCSDENPDSNSTESALKDSPVVDKLIEMGFAKERITEYENFYLVEGDLMFSKDIKSYSKNITDRHAHTNNLVSQTNVTSMTVYVAPSIPTGGADDWRAAINNAINDLNTISGSKVNFEISTSPSSDIIIQSDGNQLADNVIASAGFPTNNQPYNQVIINLDFLSNVTVTESSKRYNIVHELGHCIGLRHTNWDIRGETAGTVGANLIPNTPNQDPNSVMNGGTANYEWSGFSTYDLIAIKYLYPEPVILPQITASGPSYLSSGISLFTWTYTGNLANADLDSIIWWYSKVNGAGAPYAIGWGETGYFMAVADTFYSDPGFQTSNFIIYYTIRDTSGNLYRSPDYNIMKKGKFKLEGSL